MSFYGNGWTENCQRNNGIAKNVGRASRFLHNCLCRLKVPTLTQPVALRRTPSRMKKKIKLNIRNRNKKEQRKKSKTKNKTLLRSRKIVMIVDDLHDECTSVRVSKWLPPVHRIIHEVERRRRQKKKWGWVREKKGQITLDTLIFLYLIVTSTRNIKPNSIKENNTKTEMTQDIIGIWRPKFKVQLFFFFLFKSWTS